MTRVHCCIDLDYIIHRGGARSMAGRVTLAGCDRPATEAEVLAHAAILKARGFEVLPTCRDHDSRGHCLGHVDG